MPDFTEQQSPADLQTSKDLSLQRTRPPAEVAGYQIDRFIGSGAYGEVWAGVDRNTGRKVAVKYYRHKSGVDWSLLSREVEKLRFLSADRYVVQLLEVGWDAEPPHYVMEFVEQGSLDDHLRQHGTLSVHDAVTLFHDISIGLAHAHGKGVVHCDLKPANILLDQDKKPRLADFGQSRLSHEQKPALGTLFYMAPEQADLDAVPDVAWDVYALGAIFYALLVGAPPHRTAAMQQQLDTGTDLADRLARYRHAIRAAPPPAEHRKVPGMDRALAEIIDRCLAVNPTDRFANVQEVLDALAARERNRRRLPLMVLGFVGPLLVLLVTAFFSYRGYTRAVANAERGYGQWALQNNQFAAELAAEKVTGEIASYFEIARDEVDQSGFQPLFTQVLGLPALARLSAASAAERDRQAAQAEFRGDQKRRSLDAYLQQRLRAYQEAAKRDPRAPRFASVFVTDRAGTQVASAFGDESISESIGKNWAHRSYFHGRTDEPPPFAVPPQNPPHIERTNLSAVFRSTTQKTWKVAVSTPIFRETSTGHQFAGIWSLTVNLDDLQVARTAITGGQGQHLVLVDGREGDNQGTILHHPLFDALAATGKTVPDVWLSPQYRVPKTLLAQRHSADYRDPLAQYAGDGGIARPFDRRWIAAAAPVALPGATAEDKSSGLVVVVQSDYDSVVQPARLLGSQFVWNSFWMLTIMLTVSVTLWYVVVRMFREPSAGLHRPATPVPQSTPIGSLTTIRAAPRGKT